MIRHVAYALFIISLILLDAIFIILREINEDNVHWSFEWISFGFGCFFVLEAALRVFALRWEFCRLLCLLDALLVIAILLLYIDSIWRVVALQEDILQYCLLGALGLRFVFRLVIQCIDLSASARRLVAQNKVCYNENGFSLDLTYITPNLIAMGLPSTSIEGLYRNRIDEVASFFNTMHPDRYLIFNLCSEREYDRSLFKNRVVRFLIDDHNPPNYSQIIHFLNRAHAHTADHPDSVIALHCKGGKGRTGTMCCLYVLSVNPDIYAEQAMMFFATRRTDEGKGGKLQGVVGPSQIRYINYFEQYRTACQIAGISVLDGWDLLSAAPLCEILSVTVNVVVPPSQRSAFGKPVLPYHGDKEAVTNAGVVTAKAVVTHIQGEGTKGTKAIRVKTRPEQRGAADGWYLYITYYPMSKEQGKEWVPTPKSPSTQEVKATDDEDKKQSKPEDNNIDPVKEEKSQIQANQNQEQGEKSEGKQREAKEDNAVEQGNLPEATTATRSDSVMLDLKELFDSPPQVTPDPNGAMSTTDVFTASLGAQQTPGQSTLMGDNTQSPPSTAPTSSSSHPPPPAPSSSKRPAFTNPEIVPAEAASHHKFSVYRVRAVAYTSSSSGYMVAAPLAPHASGTAEGKRGGGGPTAPSVEPVASENGCQVNQDVATERNSHKSQEEEPRNAENQEPQDASRRGSIEMTELQPAAEGEGGMAIQPVQPVQSAASTRGIAEGNQPPPAMAYVPPSSPPPGDLHFKVKSPMPHVKPVFLQGTTTTTTTYLILPHSSFPCL